MSWQTTNQHFIERGVFYAVHYIAIKCYAKDDEAIKQKVVDQINQVFLENWGCPPEAITIFIEEFTPVAWEKDVKKGIIDSLTDGVMILEGVKQYH